MREQNNEYKISIIMPSLNVVEYIEECMESVINQTLQDIEIICVDAKSDDGTRQILEKYAQSDRRITIIDSDVKSYGYQVNAGIRAAKGQYVAILETDDFVLHDMYEKLYLLAEQYSLDYVMADFKTFSDNKDTGRVFYDREVFKNTPEIYGRILSLRDHEHIYNAGDVTLWRGIFSRKFLIFGQICLNETLGAAYQDICFMHRVRMKARRSMYINEYGYCYRTDRENSSINSVKGLQYAKYEYQYLLKNEKIPDEYRGKVYYLMSASLLGESALILPRRQYQWGAEDEECYEWFRSILNKAIEEKLLKETMGTKEWWKKLKKLLNSKADYTARLKLISDNHEKLMDIVEKATMIIVCGAGKRGAELISLLEEVGFTKKGGQIFCADNNSNIWKSYLNGVEICSVDACVQKYPEAYFMIASKFYSMDIKRQLMYGGVATEYIYEYRSGSNWD